MPPTFLPYEAAKRRVEGGDYSFEAIGALTIAHGEKLIRDYDALDHSAKIESLKPTLWAHNGADLAAVLTWDRAGLKHCMTMFDYRAVGRTIEASYRGERRTCIIDWSQFSAGGNAA